MIRGVSRKEVGEQKRMIDLREADTEKMSELLKDA